MKIQDLLAIKAIRITLAVFFALVIILQRQFSPEFYYFMNQVVYYGFIVPCWPLIAAVKGFVPFKLSYPDLYSKIIYIVLHFIWLMGLIICYFNRRSLTITALKIIGMWFGFALVCNLTGKLFYAESLKLSGRMLIDLLFGPFSAVFLIPVLLLALKGEKAREKAAAGKI